MDAFVLKHNFRQNNTSKMLRRARVWKCSIPSAASMTRKEMNAPTTTTTTTSLDWDTQPTESPPPSTAPTTQMFGLVYNPFSRRMISTESKIVEDIAKCGIGISPDSPHRFSLLDPTKLVNCFPKQRAVAAKKKKGVTAAGEDVDWVKPRAPAKKPKLSWKNELQELVTQHPSQAPARVREFLDSASDMRASAYLPARLVRAADESHLDGMALTSDQQSAVNLACQGYSMYVGGSAGTGKTIALRAIVTALRSKGLNVVPTATTGVAAVQLGGTTFHSAFGVPMKPTQNWDLNAIRATDVVIIDESSLLDLTLFEAFDAKCRFARLRGEPFGGIQVVLCGDFLQLSMDRITESPCYKSHLFKDFVTCQLTTPMRQKDPNLLSILSNLRVGMYDPRLESLDDKPPAVTSASSPPGLATDGTPSAAPSAESSSPAAAAQAQRHDDPDATYLFPKRVHAAVVNEKRLSALPGEEEIYLPKSGMLTQLGSNFTETAVVSITPKAGREVVNEVARQMNLGIGEIMMMPVNLCDNKFCIRARGGARPIANGAFQKAVETEVSKAGGLVTNWQETPFESQIPYSVSATAMELGGPGSSSSTLRLKVGARIMVVRNLSNKICNGSIGTVESFEKPDAALYPTGFSRQSSNQNTSSNTRPPYPLLPVVKFQTGERFMIPPVSDVVGGNADTYFYGTEIHSLPVSLGYAFTVHKVQGVTLNGKVVVDCEDMFNCEHLIYVACSRIKTIDQLVVRNIKPEMVSVRESAMEFASSLPPAGAISYSNGREGGKLRGAWISSTPASTPLNALAA